ncbi:hypothetical protein [Litoribacter populi]|uniref:hypothetical protein n=1 Tax=Litoribacter populi TaxID=2598460 RepID=UPI001180429D|nr:hypothetical protein [Litoribacter populi]
MGNSNFAYGVLFVLFVLFGVQFTTIDKNPGKEQIVWGLEKPNLISLFVSSQNLKIEAASFEAVVPSLNTFSFPTKEKLNDSAFCDFTSRSSLNSNSSKSYCIPKFKVGIASGMLDYLYPYFFFF